MRGREAKVAMWCAAVTVGFASSSSLLINVAQTKTSDATPKIESQEAFTVVGIAARTNNAKEAGPDGIIGKQWGRFFGEGVAAKIPDRADENIVAVYTDYASDVNGDYTFLLGVRVTKADSVPDGMVAKTVPAGRYAVFTSERGQVQRVVVDTWKRIWATPKTALGGERSYKSDFELYDQRARNPADSVVEIHIGVR